MPLNCADITLGDVPSQPFFLSGQFTTEMLSRSLLE